MKKLKTKLSTAMLLLALVLGVQRMSSCNKPCTVEKDCGFTSTTINAIDTIYYPYVSDFANEGKIYTYEITVDSKTFIRSYKMSTFEHHYETEFNYYNRDDCSVALPCDTTINRWYEMNCEEVNGQGFAILEVRLNSFYFLFSDLKSFFKDIRWGYLLQPNSSKTDTLVSDFDMEIKWHENLTFGNNTFSNVSTRLSTDTNGDTLWFDIYNKENGIIYNLYNEKNENHEIKLLNIQ